MHKALKCYCIKQWEFYTNEFAYIILCEQTNTGLNFQNANRELQSFQKFNTLYAQRKQETILRIVFLGVGIMDF